jgi:hypothetical protein
MALFRRLYLDEKVWLRSEPDRHVFRMKLKPVIDVPRHAIRHSEDI